MLPTSLPLPAGRRGGRFLLVMRAFHVSRSPAAPCSLPPKKEKNEKKEKTKSSKYLFEGQSRFVVSVLTHLATSARLKAAKSAALSC